MAERAGVTLAHMDIQSMIRSIDEEIARLEQARSILSDTSTTTINRGSGRPKNVPDVHSPIKKKRTMSAEGKARIAAAQKKRWAAKHAAKWSP